MREIWGIIWDERKICEDGPGVTLGGMREIWGEGKSN